MKEKFFIQLAIMAIFILCVSSLSANYLNFGEAGKYSLFVYENLNHTGADCEGAVAVGGDLNVTNGFDAGAFLPVGGNQDGVGMYVRGNLNMAGSWGWVNAIHGDLHFGSYSSTRVSVRESNKTIYSPPVFNLDFETAQQHLVDLSAYYRSLPANGTINVDNIYWRKFEFIGTDPLLNVWNLTIDEWQNANGCVMNAPETATNIINIGGAADIVLTDHSGFGQMSPHSSTHPAGDQILWTNTVWNFYEMENMNKGNIQWEGNILAPYCDFVYTSGQVNGHLFVKSLTGSGGGEVHYHPYTGHVIDFDFGDTPDDGYPSYLASDGARHIIVDGIHLGNIIDAETDGHEDYEAAGDDADNSDDEDGVIFLDPIFMDSWVNINVNASVDGYLNAWFDLNMDGDWDESNEQIFINEPLTAGDNALSFYIPMHEWFSRVISFDTYSRFRFTSQVTSLDFTGLALDGEVEDYHHQLILAASIGDYVWYDTDLNGLQHVDEVGIADVTVNLYKNTAEYGEPDYYVPIGTSTTDATGFYLFDYLLQGEYKVEFIRPQDYSITYKDEQSNDQYDSDADQEFGITDPIQLWWGNANRDVDCGMYKEDGLPVDFSSFAAAPYQITDEQGIAISWQTNSEEGIENYFIFKSLTNSLINAANISPSGIDPYNTSVGGDYLFQDNDIIEDTTYHYWIKCQELDGTFIFTGPVLVKAEFEENNQGVDTPKIIPKVGITNVYPNPFNPTTSIRYYVDTYSAVFLNIYNIRGQKIYDANMGNKDKGTYGVSWNGVDNNGKPVASGVYFFRLNIDSNVSMQKAILLK